MTFARKSWIHDRVTTGKIEKKVRVLHVLDTTLPDYESRSNRCARCNAVLIVNHEAQYGDSDGAFMSLADYKDRDLVTAKLKDPSFAFCII